MKGCDTIWRKQSGVEWSVIKCIRGYYRTLEKDNVVSDLQFNCNTNTNTKQQRAKM